MAGCHAEPAKGRVNGKPKISLETYVQLEYFDRIIRYANLRLLHMSRGQYELKRRQLPEQGTRGEVGLDLDVIDHYNGSIREVATLSGGESFLASLSLALTGNVRPGAGERGFSGTAGYHVCRRGLRFIERQLP